jgi:DNA-binding transcriptional regulator YiaG
MTTATKTPPHRQPALHPAHQRPRSNSPNSIAAASSWNVCFTGSPQPQPEEQITDPHSEARHGEDRQHDEGAVEEAVHGDTSLVQPPRANHLYIHRQHLFFLGHLMNEEDLVADTTSGIKTARMISPAQIRGARAMLGWSAAELAKRAGLSYSTVQKAETSNGVPRIRTENVVAIQQALEEGGVIFLDVGDVRSGGPGVRLK